MMKKIPATVWMRGLPIKKSLPAFGEWVVDDLHCRYCLYLLILRKKFSIAFFLLLPRATMMVVCCLSPGMGTGTLPLSRSLARARACTARERCSLRSLSVMMPSWRGLSVGFGFIGLISNSRFQIRACVSVKTACPFRCFASALPRERPAGARR